MMQLRRVLLAVLAAGLAAMAGCRGGTDSTTPGQGPVLALVAASTKDAVEEVATAFAQDGGAEIKVSADDSSRLATQIVNGAPAHLFLSANEKWAEHIRDKGMVQETTPLLGNSLVIVVPRNNPANVRKPDDLVKPALKRLALAGPTVPAGIYARQALKAQGLWEQVERRVIAGENVRVTLAYVDRGEADAGIVYATDARITDGVEQVFEFAQSTHDPISYPLVLLKGGADNPQARRFYEFLCSPQAAGIFKKHGFTWLGGG
jgi:molybdate transport system substrate-binding protein